MNPTPILASLALAGTLAGTLVVIAALPAHAASSREIDATYRQDRAACMSAGSLHERSSCLRESGAVRNEARRNMRAASATPEARAANALQRCANLPGDHRTVCERMVQGEGAASGSVEGGGVLRSLETEVPTVPAAPAQ